MDKRAHKTLKRIYRKNDYEFDRERGLYIYDTSVVPSADLAYVTELGYPPNQFERLTHDDIVARLRRAVRAVDASEVAQAFIAGVGGSDPRGRQSLISFTFARHLPGHSFESMSGNISCRVCGAPEEKWVDVTEGRWRAHVGHCWNEFPAHYVADLEELPDLARIEPTEADIGTLRALLELADSLGATDPPGALEKAVRSRRVVPKTDKYKRYGILAALAEVGVLSVPTLPSRWERWVTFEDRHAANASLGRSHRSDLPWPLSGWRGDQGVDWTVAADLFGVPD